MSAGEILGIWLAGFVIIQIAVRLMLKSEPTAHGQIVGRQFGCIIGLVWPIALPWFLLVGLFVGAGRLFRRKPRP